MITNDVGSRLGWLVKCNENRQYQCYSFVNELLFQLIISNLSIEIMNCFGLFVFVWLFGLCYWRWCWWYIDIEPNSEQTWPETRWKNSNRKRNWEQEKDSLMNLHRWTTIKQQQILNGNRICWNQVKHFWLFIYLLLLLFFRCCCISVGFKMNWLKNKPNAIIDLYQLKNENGINFVTLEIKRKRLILKQRKKWTKMHIGRHIFLAFSVDSDWLTG